MLGLIATGQKKIGQLEDSEMENAANVVGRENAPVLLDLFEFLRETSPETRVMDLLKDERVGDLLKRGLATINKKPASDSVLCRCPECGFAFETDLN